jgi:uncharacterized protein (DUF2062 family)
MTHHSRHRHRGAKHAHKHLVGDLNEPQATEGPHWTERLRNAIPTREVLMEHPWLKPIAYRLLDPKLWRLQHEAVARGVAIGTFWAFAIPAGQFVASTAHCVWWRGNIPVAAGVTMVTNPLTIGFWLWLAYQLGSLLLGNTTGELPPLQFANAGEWLMAYGGPAILGMGLFATVGAAIGYALVKIGWRIKIWHARRSRAVKQLRA